MIPKDVIDRTREATNIVELISGYVRLKQRGQNFIGLCPFHSEKTPSFNVNPARQIYHCFGCGKGGDAFKFLMEHEHMGFFEAITVLAERAHIELPKSPGRSDDPADRIYQANATALEYFRKALEHETVGKGVRAYLEERRIKKEQADTFEIGYAPNRARGLITYAERTGVTLADLERAGLIFQDDSRARDRFSERLMFPIRNLSGRPIAFGGRDLTGQARAKYLNSPESSVYQKGRVLYGLYEARREIQQSGEVLVCEGYMDLIRLHEFGFCNVVAASGTAFSSEQARLLARYARTARLLFDGDGPGMAAALRSVAVLFDAGLDVSIVSLRSGEDPDSCLLRAGADALRERMAQAQGYVEYCEERAGGSFAALGPGAQDRLLREIADTVAKITDPVRRDLVGNQVWSRFGISEVAFRARLGKSPTPASGRAAPRDDTLRSSVDAGWRSEFLQFLLLNPAVRAEATSLVPIEDFTDPLHRRLLGLLFDPANAETEAQELMQVEKERELSALIRILASGETPFEGSELPDYVRKLKRRRLEVETKELLRRIREAELGAHPAGLDELSAAYHKAREEWLRLDKEVRKKGD